MRAGNVLMIAMFITPRYKHKDTYISYRFQNITKSIRVNFILWLNNEGS